MAKYEVMGVHFEHQLQWYGSHEELTAEENDHLKQKSLFLGLILVFWNIIPCTSILVSISSLDCK
ncbi:hypothetical protein C0J52_27682 [Blattella germanica]|nr:hypothetical protein C0J52_27682 [Blattella germanica]